jgi:serine/threonine protein kinase
MSNAPADAIITDAEYALLKLKRVPFAALKDLRDPAGHFNGKNTDFQLATVSVAGGTDAADVREIPVLVKRVQLATSVNAPVVSVDETLEVKDWPGLSRNVVPQRKLREIAIGLQTPHSNYLCPTLAWCTKPDDEMSVYSILFSFHSDLSTYMCAIYEAHKAAGAQPHPVSRYGFLGKDQFGLIAQHTALGICELHTGMSNGGPAVVHRDLKIANIFLSVAAPREAGVELFPRRVVLAAVGDFGISRREGTNPTLVNVGTPGYGAPELDKALRDPSIPIADIITPKADVFSFGATLWRMLHFPRKLPEVRELLREYRGTKPTDYYPLKCDEEAPKDLAALIVHCTQYLPKDRPTMKDVQDRLKAIFGDVPPLELQRVESTHPIELRFDVGRNNANPDAATDLNSDAPADSSPGLLPQAGTAIVEGRGDPEFKDPATRQ